MWAAADLCLFLQLDPYTRKICKLISLHPNPSYLVPHSAILPRCPKSQSSILGLQKNYCSSRGPDLGICLEHSVISIFLCDKFFGLFCFATRSQIWSRMTLKSQSSLLTLLSAGLMGMQHHTWLLLTFRLNCKNSYLAGQSSSGTRL